MMNTSLPLGQAASRRSTERCSVIPTDDPCVHAASLRDWMQDYLQLSAGRFLGEIIETTIGPIQIFRETIWQCVDEKANPRRNSYTVGVPVYMEEGGYWQGYRVARDSLMMLRPNEELHFRTPKKSTILVVVIDSGVFDAFSRDTTGRDTPLPIAGSHTRELPEAMIRPLRMSLKEVLSSAVSTPEVLEHENSMKAMVETILGAALHAVLARSAESEVARSSHFVQRAIVERARQYVLANRQSPPTVTELSAWLKMSRRGLHHAFMNVLGINVVTFLRYVRLHGARKDLLMAGPEGSVNRIACKWGFWHMGMFSAYYKALFGELPSATLRKTSCISITPGH